VTNCNIHHFHCCWPPVTSKADISMNQLQHTKHCWQAANHNSQIFTSNRAWRREGGRQDKQSCTTHWQATHFQALYYAWCVPLQNVLYTSSWWLNWSRWMLKWCGGRKCVGYTWQSEGIWPIRTMEGVEKVSLIA
jgi:hypothetical protein